MNLRYALFPALFLAGCVSAHSTMNGGVLVLKPQVLAGTYNTQTALPNYTKTSIHHLILKLYTYDTSEHDISRQQSLLNSQLDSTIVFSNLKANTTYRIKAYAYASADESVLVSTTDASSYTDVTLTNDDHPTLASLKVKLVDRAFNGQATASGVVITPGGYMLGNEAMQFLIRGRVTTPTLTYADGIAGFANPYSVASDKNGNLYVADTFHHRVRKISSNWVVTTVAGNGVASFADGTGTAASFNQPYAVAVDSQGNVYVADRNNNRIRKIDTNNVVTTFAGNASPSYADGTGTSAAFNLPYDVAVDTSNNVYVADECNNRIRKITSGGIVTTMAGGAMFSSPTGLTVDSQGNIYVAEWSGYRISKIDTNGNVSVFAGSASGYADGTGTVAAFANPWSLTIDPMGNLYVADEHNNRIRKIDPNRVVTTVAGHTAAGSENGTGAVAGFSLPLDVEVDAQGNLFVADQGNSLIRMIQ